MNFKQVLDEIFDNPIQISRNKEVERGLPHSIEIYDSVNYKAKIQFYLLKRENAWEVHFENISESIPKYTGAETSRIIATAVSLLKTKETKTTPFRLFGKTEKMSSLWLKVGLKFFPDSKVIEQRNFVGLDGITYPVAYLLQKETRSFQIEKFKEII